MVDAASRPSVPAITAQPSFCSAALLGLPSKEGWLVNARIRVDMEIEGHGRFESSQGGIPFDFAWVYPDEQGFTAIQQRLKKLLAASTDRVHQAYYINALLKIPEVAQAVSLDELLAAIQRREGALSGRNVIHELKQRLVRLAVRD